MSVHTETVVIECHPSVVVQILRDVGGLAHWLPGVRAVAAPPARPARTGDRVDAFAADGSPVSLRYAAVAPDLVSVEATGRRIGELATWRVQPSLFGCSVQLTVEHPSAGPVVFSRNGSEPGSRPSALRDHVLDHVGMRLPA